MKILSIISSYRMDGNTSRIVSLVEEQLKNKAARQGTDLSIERISLGRMDVQTCRGCRLCFDRGEDKCPLKDDLLTIRDRMLEADGYLVASPVYVEDVNGILKNWIDRLAFFCHRPVLMGKCAYLITTSGGGSTNHALKTMATAFSAWGARVCGRAKFRAGALTIKEELAQKHGKSIRRAADAFMQDLVRGTDCDPGWYSLIAFRVQQICWDKKSYQQSNPFDYAYWKGKGWLEPGRTYYIPLKRKTWKVGVARLLGSGVARFFV